VFGPGASTAPELDGALAAVDGIELRMPYMPLSRVVTVLRIGSGMLQRPSDPGQAIWWAE